MITMGAVGDRPTVRGAAGRRSFAMPVREPQFAEMLPPMKHQPVTIQGNLPPYGNGRAGGVRPRVLLADEDIHLRDAAARVLAACYEVEVVADGAAALTAIGQRPPDLVIAGGTAARLDSWLGQLRADPRTAAIPVIVLAERTGEGCRLDGLDAGADDFLV